MKKISKITQAISEAVDGNGNFEEKNGNGDKHKNISKGRSNSNYINPKKILTELNEIKSANEQTKQLLIKILTFISSESNENKYEELLKEFDKKLNMSELKSLMVQNNKYNISLSKIIQEINEKVSSEDNKNIKRLEEEIKSTKINTEVLYELLFKIGNEKDNNKDWEELIKIMKKPNIQKVERLPNRFEKVILMLVISIIVILVVQTFIYYGII